MYPGALILTLISLIFVVVAVESFIYLHGACTRHFKNRFVVKTWTS